MKTKTGFTGTQHGMTENQKMVLAKILDFLNGELHHGACIGADEEAHNIANNFENICIVVHPPIKTDKMATVTGHITRNAKEYLARDRDIVDETERLIACPKGYKEERRSGTWTTVRHAIKTKKPVTIIFPDGSVEIK